MLNKESLMIKNMRTILLAQILQFKKEIKDLKNFMIENIF